MEDLDDILTCAVCLDFYNSPRKLPCHHVYCLECLRGLRNKDTSILTCPECRVDHVIPDADKIPIDHRIIKFIEVQKNLSASIKSSEESGAACSASVKKPGPGISIAEVEGEDEDGNLRFLESKIVRDSRELFTLINQQETKEIILQQKDLLNKKKIVIKKTRINVDNATEEAKKELDKRRNELHHQLDEQGERIDIELKKFDYMNTISEDISFFRNSLFEKSSYNDMLSIHALLEESKQKLTDLMQLGTKYKVLNSVTFEKNFNELKYAIQQFGELVEMEKSLFNQEIEDINLILVYRNKWDIMTVTDVGSNSKPRKIRVNPHNGNVYLTSSRGVIEYDMEGKVGKIYETKAQRCAVTFDQEGRIIVITQKSSDNAIAVKYDSQGGIMREFTIPGAGNNRYHHFDVTDAASDSKSRLYVTDSLNTNQVQVLNNDGTFICCIEDIKEMACPGSLCIDTNKTNNEYPRLLVSDDKLNKVLVFDVKGDRCDFVKDMDVNKPSDICMDTNGNLLVASNADKSITVLDKNGDQMACISEPAEALNDIGGIAITDNDVLCVTSRADGKVYFLHRT